MSHTSLGDVLKSALASSSSNITNASTEQERWSTYKAPTPKYIVHVASESDLAAVIKVCDERDTKFLISNGANGWTTTFDLGSSGVVIDLSPLNQITFHDSQTATIQAGVTVKQLNEACYTVSPKRRVASPTCNCLGWLGAALGGGLARTIGHDGLMVDQILSARVVLANGTVVTTDPDNHPDLFWAIRGAGPNFGVVVSAEIKTYPAEVSGDTINVDGVMSQWQGAFEYSGDKIQQLFDAADKLELEPYMQQDITISFAGTPDTLSIATTSVRHIYDGSNISQADAEESYKLILDVGPKKVTWDLLPYNHWNDISNATCGLKGNRLLAYAAGSKNLDGYTWKCIYEEVKAFIDEHAGKGLSLLFLQPQTTPIKPAIQIGKEQKDGGGAYPWRDIRTQVVLALGSTDRSFDGTAIKFAEKLRSMLRSTAGMTGSYINFAHGDEPLEQIYGGNLPRLQTIKEKYDPKNRFNQWFPISKSSQ